MDLEHSRGHTVTVVMLKRPLLGVLDQVRNQVQVDVEHRRLPEAEKSLAELLSVVHAEARQDAVLGQ